MGLVFFLDLLNLFTDSGCKFGQEMGNVIVERRHVEIPRAGERPNLRPPPSKQGGALMLYQLCKFVENVDSQLPSDDATH